MPSQIDKNAIRSGDSTAPETACALSSACTALTVTYMPTCIAMWLERYGNMAIYGFMGFGAKSELDGVEWIPLRVLSVRLLRQLKKHATIAQLIETWSRLLG